MHAKRKPRQKPTSLSRGRPPTVRKATTTLSSKATRTLIRSHHQLQKALQDAERAGDGQAAATVKQEIERLGGLERYQQASLQGQAKDRGGDTSKLLLEWLQDRSDHDEKPLRMLEVGALSTSNACSRSKMFEVTRIDLHSQTAGIEQQDFMVRPLPSSDRERYNIISLSLVVNYVPSAEGRGEMLRRTRNFLIVSQDQDTVKDITWIPALFLVLPAPCVTNSRYMNEDRLKEIMHSLGYTMIRRKLSAKLVYYLWQLVTPGDTPKQQFPKIEVNQGRDRNNFSIILG